MIRNITLHLSHPDGISTDGVEGFNFFWAFRISGFRPEVHCQPCFRGTVVPDFHTRTVRAGADIEARLSPQHRYLYVCGVGSGPKRELHAKNFHLALRHEPGSVVERRTYNGYLLTARDAVELPIQGPLQGDEWADRSLETRRCKNFRFAVQYLGVDRAKGERDE